MHRRRNTKDENGKFFVLADDDNKKYDNNRKKNRCGLFILLGVLANLAVFLMVQRHHSNKEIKTHQQQQAPTPTKIVSDSPPAALNKQLRTSPEPTAAVSSRPGPQPPRIPRRLIFTYKYKLIAPSDEDPPLDPSDPLTANVLRTIQKYDKFWAKDKHIVREKMQVSFLTDKDCAALVKKADRRLLKHWNLERRGELRADICRTAELYLNGGYYFDIDIKAMEPVNVDTLYAPSVPIPEGMGQLRMMKQGGAPPLKLGKDDIVTFATVYNHNGRFFNSFTAATPGHPVLKKNLEYMFAYYEGTQALSKVLPEFILEEHKLEENPLPSRRKPYGKSVGPYTLQAAYRGTTDDEWEQHVKDLMKEKGYSPGQEKISYEAVPAKKRYSRFLYEVSLENEGLKGLDLFQDMPLQDADFERKREICNNIVFSGETVYFYSRVPGSRICPLDGTVEIPIPPPPCKKGETCERGGYH